MGPAAGRRDPGGAVSTFDLTGPLPRGTTVLEASAGTGKTYAIVGLAARYVAEGVADIADILLVTFSKAATRELRERTRARFTELAGALRDPVAARVSDDELTVHLAGVSDPEVAVRRGRLLRALSEFDAGTIATTHSFCQRMLDGLGIAGEPEPGATFVESVDDIVVDVVDDLYLQRYSRLASEPPVTPQDARAVGRAAVSDRRAVLGPDVPDGTEAGDRVALARDVRIETERRKRRVGIRDYDDLLGLLHDVLIHPDHGAAACRRIRDRFRVVLVDEFQDTDPLQWEILRRTFHGHGGVLVLVGDPKQAIYAFRGAEVTSYLEAVAVADHLLALTTNRRSDEAVVRSLAHLYEGAALGADEIVVTGVSASHRTRRLTGPSGTTDPMRLRVLPRTGCGPLNKAGFASIDRIRRRIADDVADQIVALLTSGAEVDGVPIGPGDIAVLVRYNKEAGMVRTALDAAAVPSVLTGGADVFATPAAADWLRVLEAVEQPHRADVVRRAALTPLLGWTAERLDAEGDAATSELSARFRELAGVVERVGFAAMVEMLTGATGLQARLLGRERGERDVTDLTHVAQLLDREFQEAGHGVASLGRWLADRVADPTLGSGADRSRRLDSDADAVQVATVHAAKGLEYPVVFVPYGWAASGAFDQRPLLYHEDGRRILDVGGPTARGYAARRLLHDDEAAGEELRLLYVALTRARSQVVVWWAPSFTTKNGPLHRLLFGRVDGVPAPERSIRVPADEAALSALAARAGDSMTVEAVGATGSTGARLGRRGATGTPAPLAAAVFDRRLDHAWHRTSYTALTAGAHHDRGADASAAVDESEDPGVVDEPESVLVAGVEHAIPSEAALPSPMNGLPAGAAFGTLVHDVLEFVDTSATDLAAELEARCRDAASRLGADLDPAHLARALGAVLRTPLGFGTLAEVAPADRLSELDFELPLGGGDRADRRCASVHDIADLLTRHLPADDVLGEYPSHLRRLDDRELRGYLTGSIDSVIRVRGRQGGGEPRFVVVDYKTNRIVAGDLTVDHFTTHAMATEMIAAHYPLQALLYSVALHRFLRWRLPGYRPDVHLGGVQYHFVRGMAGPRTPAGRGVFAWHPSAALVTDLSDLVSGGAA
ncbi:UvrD-helicase domain-containing protein [Rhodococcoides corynebacterioides]|uniref:UvrD-helicase domain-containing protein n=1 Tax=Rhodococcoides corynebacterioides TaxID=53972 RepID=UPI000832BE9A|nr:UvrD-helicase domain-containing protein [Rhodococcus corynebacterioides]